METAGTLEEVGRTLRLSILAETEWQSHEGSACFQKVRLRNDSARSLSRLMEIPDAQATAASAMRTALSRQEIEALMNAGATAPSYLNLQPWRCVARGDLLLVGVDEERSGCGLDGGGYPTNLALGSFCEAVEVGARAAGLKLAGGWQRGARKRGEIARYQLSGRFSPNERA